MKPCPKCGTLMIITMREGFITLNCINCGYIVEESLRGIRDVKKG